MLIYVLRWQSSWISDRHKKKKPVRGPSNDYSWAVWFQLSKWFKRRSLHEPVGTTNVRIILDPEIDRNVVIVGSMEPKQ
jgi:hypothetical protein